MRLAKLQGSSKGPAVRLDGAHGLVGFVGDGGPTWGSFVEGLHARYEAYGDVAGPGPSVGTDDDAVPVGSPSFEERLQKALAASGLSREQYAAIWFGAGSVETWLAAGVALIRGEDGADELDRLSDALSTSVPIAVDTRDRAAAWANRLKSELEADLERLAGTKAEIAELEAQLLAHRAEAAEVGGDLEVGMMTWVRERQDAETRLLLYRDRERELRSQIERVEQDGPGAECSACKRPLEEESEAVGNQLQEEWESVVQDGRWWRKRRDQLEYKPDELKEVEAKALALGALIEDLSEEIERLRTRLRQRKMTEVRLSYVSSLAEEIGVGREEPDPVEDLTEGAAEQTLRDLEGAKGRLDHQARERFRARLHGKLTALTGGRLVGSFPSLYDDWCRGGRRGGGEVSILELAARITMAELAVEAGVALGSVLLPTSLDRLNPEDLPRALADLSRLTRKVPLVLVKVTEPVASSAPERFDLLLRSEDTGSGLRIRRQRSGVGTLFIQQVS